MKKNCWEFKRCGREPGGKNASALGMCSAASDKRLHAVDGTNAGRACWVIAGTLCGGKVQGTFAQKYENCASCNFFHTVKAEEGGKYKLAITLLNRLK